MPPPEASGNKSSVLYTWMKKSRERDPEAQRLAGIAIQSEHWFRLFLWVFSFVAGVSAGAALLRYEGVRLINISAYLGILVGGQLLMLLGLTFSLVFFRRPIRQLHTLLLPRIVKTLPSPLSLPAWGWRFFCSFQQAGVALNLGILMVTFWKVSTYDLAFGWATTLDAGGESIHQLVQILATPWGGKFAPNLEQIEQSRIILKAGLAQIDSRSTASWWPFLLMCVTFYGLFPRLILSLIGSLGLHLTLKTPAFSSPESEKLFLALTRKPLTFTKLGKTLNEVSEPRKNELQALVPEDALKLEIHPDVLAEEDLEAFSLYIKELLGIELSDDAGGKVKVMELWQPPLEETLRILQKDREKIGPQADLLILGTGLPSSEDFFKAPAEKDVLVWQKKLSELKDPRLGLIPWRTR